MRSAEEQHRFARELRNNPTEAELAMWRILSRMRPRWTRQLKLRPFVGDFACRRARVIIEADGSQHADNAADVGRTRALNRNGWLVIRFWNNEILGNPDGVVQAIVAAVERRLPPEERVEFVTSRAGRERKPRGRDKKTQKKKKSHP